MATTKYYGTGRRKSSVARVYLVPGNGNITINSCYTTGNVTGNSNVGGFAGYIYAGNNSGDSYYQVHIENSFASGNVTGNSSDYTGGFVGYAYESDSSDSYPMDGDIYIYTCYAYGTVSFGKGFLVTQTQVCQTAFTTMLIQLRRGIKLRGFR